MRIRTFGVLTVGILALALSGCNNGNALESKSVEWESPDGNYTLTLNANEWKVEEESNGELHFQNEKYDNFSFSISKWEDLQFPEDFDYEVYYAGYVEDSKVEFPDVVETGFEFIELEETGVVQKGVRYEVLDELCQVTTSMISVPDSEDTLCFVAIYPAAKSEEQGQKFKDIVTGIKFLQ